MAIQELTHQYAWFSDQTQIYPYHRELWWWGLWIYKEKTPCKKGEVDLGPIHVRILRLRQNHSAHSWHRELAIHRQKTCRMCWPFYLSMTWSSALPMWRRQKRCNCEIHASVINVIKQESTSLRAAMPFSKTLFFSCALGRLSKKTKIMGFLPIFFDKRKLVTILISSEANIIPVGTLPTHLPNYHWSRPWGWLDL